jgi:hypothetical protein
MDEWMHVTVYEDGCNIEDGVTLQLCNKMGVMSL